MRLESRRTLALYTAPLAQFGVRHTNSGQSKGRPCAGRWVRFLASRQGNPTAPGKQLPNTALGPFTRQMYLMIWVVGRLGLLVKQPFDEEPVLDDEPNLLLVVLSQIRPAEEKFGKLVLVAIEIGSRNLEHHR